MCCPTWWKLPQQQQHHRPPLSFLHRCRPSSSWVRYDFIRWLILAGRKACMRMWSGHFSLFSINKSKIEYFNQAFRCINITSSVYCSGKWRITLMRSYLEFVEGVVHSPFFCCWFSLFCKTQISDNISHNKWKYFCRQSDFVVEGEILNIEHFKW